MINIAQLLTYWGEEPPTHVILALKYLGERKSKGPKNEGVARDQIREAAGMLGQNVQPVSQRTRDLVAYAEEVKARMCRSTHGR